MTDQPTGEPVPEITWGMRLDDVLKDLDPDVRDKIGHIVFQHAAQIARLFRSVSKAPRPSLRQTKPKQEKVAEEPSKAPIKDIVIAWINYRGKNATQVAIEANLSPATVYDIVSGKTRRPEFRTLEAIARRSLGISVETLVNRVMPSQDDSNTNHTE